MDELSDYTSPVVGFIASNTTDTQLELIDCSTETDPLPLKIDAFAETHTQRSEETQTETRQLFATNVDETKLANWLENIYGNVAKELLKGCTPALNAYSSESSADDIVIQPYQTLSVAAVRNSQGLAIWLSLYTNNAPVLVVTTVAPHDDWCEHIDQSLKLFVPKRVPKANFITYREEKSVPVKACLKSLSTNPFNKNVFAGSTFDGDIYVWEFEQHYRNHANSGSSIEVKEIHHATVATGYAVAIDWCSEFILLTAHANGRVVQWHLGKEIIREEEYIITGVLNSGADICSLLALDSNTFAVGTKDGFVFHCSSSCLPTGKRHLEMLPLKKHLFMVSTLLRTHVNGHKMVVSCDLSGEVFFHDLRNPKDDTDTAVTQMPLPFSSTIACSTDGSCIYSPGDDGSLECYRLCDGSQSTVKGALKGRGNFIKQSDNGCWLISGIYEDEFQIFLIEG